MYFTSKRQQFLIDQGYSYKVGIGDFLSSSSSTTIPRPPLTLGAARCAPRSFARQVITNFLENFSLAAFDPDADVDPSDIDPKTRLPHRLILGTLEDQISLLASVLHASEEIEANEENDGIGADGATGTAKAASNRKVGGSMAALSGAKGIKYMEYSSGVGSGRDKLAKKAQGEKKLAKLRKLK